MAGRTIQVAVDKKAYRAGKSIFRFRFLNCHHGKFLGAACLPESRGGIQGVKIPGNGKNQGNNVLFPQQVFPQKFVVQRRRLFPDINSLVMRPCRPAQGGKAFFGDFAFH
jgi:hypothetical protein